MAKNRNSGAALALTGSGRWLGGGAVALVHLAFLLALLATDRLTFHKAPDGRAITVYRLPDDTPQYAKSPEPITLPRAAASVPSSVLAPKLAGPMILIQPERQLPPNLRGLDLSTRPSSGLSPLTQDDLLPSKETKLKKFFAESDLAARLAREPAAGEDCKVSITSQKNAASLGESAFKDPLPLESVCTPTQSAKDLNLRNNRFAPQ